MNDGTIYGPAYEQIVAARDAAEARASRFEEALRAIADWGLEPDADYQRMSWANIAAKALEAGR